MVVPGMEVSQVLCRFLLFDVVDIVIEGPDLDIGLVLYLDPGPLAKGIVKY